MNKKLRTRILEKLAQTQPEQPAQPVVSSPPAVPGVLYANLNQGYNPATAQLLMKIGDQLNTAVHYASQGKDNFQSFLNNNFQIDANKLFSVDQGHLRGLSKMFFTNFLNSRNAFTQKVDPRTLSIWCDRFTNSNDFSSLSQINPTGQLATKVPQNIRTSLLDTINQIKAQNPQRT